MSTDVTRGPKMCPSCGRENPPTAIRCASCLTPLDGAVQTAPTPAPREMPDPDHPGLRPSASQSGCLSFLGLVGVVFFTIISAGVTFFLTCSVTAYMDDRLGVRGVAGESLQLIATGMATVAVVALIIVAYRRLAGRWRTAGMVVVTILLVLFAAFILVLYIHNIHNAATDPVGHH